MSERARGATIDLAREVARGITLGAAGFTLGLVALRDPERGVEWERAGEALVALALWTILLPVCVRAARGASARVRPVVAFPLLAFVVLLVIAPVAWATLRRLRGGPAVDPFSGWDEALTLVLRTIDPGTLAGASAWGGLVPFIAVGATWAARPRAPAWALATLAAATGHLGFAFAARALTDPAPLALTHGLRHALIFGVPAAVAGMALARRGVPRRSWAWLLAPAVVAMAVVAHPRHLVDHLVRLCFTSSVWGVSDEAHEARWALRGAATDALIAHLDDRDADVRLAALLGLAQRQRPGRIGQDLGLRPWRAAEARLALPALIATARDDPAPRVRAYAGQIALALVGAALPDQLGAEAEASTIVDIIDLALAEADPGVREGLASDIYNLRHAYVGVALRARLARAQADERLRLARWLTVWTWLHPDLATDDDVDAMLRAWADPTIAPPEAAAATMLDGTPYGVPIGHVLASLKRGLEDDDPRVRALAAEALARLAGDGHR
jgi:hypothetical protein